ncbi:hypothetical protein ACXR2U_00970 [Jatrophihabitans sp. YIM 134969]
MEYVTGAGGAVGGTDPAEAEARMAAFRRRQVPENEAPVSVGWDAVLLESADVVVLLAGARVYSTGVEITVVVNARRDEDDPQGVARGLFDPRAGADVLLLGVEYADGRTGSTSGGMQAVFAEAATLAADAVTFAPVGGGGGSRHATRTFFLSPVPPVGPLRLVAAWPARGLEERVVRLTADPIAAAQAGVRRLWDVEPRVPRPPRRPPVPPGGWFERNQSADSEPGPS